ncbi:Mitochondrial 2-oxoadipate and 2-oxoglutarate transporter [Pleodorina starrii]|uniref:ornithine decarboxylase n=1 Tax=Pleodorina starrii TaxID=330485 RepID=A0A9W6B9V1_9CHLO|nr:Mitochondrial 2-oxoadipate and 2-oxoglutarate transporter [Pleodorina starrii]GLC48139.1 Mitochondrial 2-oxoadipate and 2-oxoglutarate transporter [Pleodorina starrii]GLC67386.1 Mitochondrial 2-oxoadipate and 2-oxoglutarate transporter [Pleodorina starrii]
MTPMEVVLPTTSLMEEVPSVVEDGPESTVEGGDFPALAMQASVASRSCRSDVGRTSLGHHANGTPTDLKLEAEAKTALAAAAVQPVDRGPALATAGSGAAPDASMALLSSWQYRVTGNGAVAQVLTDFHCEHIKSGGPRGVQEVAIRHILRNDIDSDSIYCVDLAAPFRLFKAWRAAMPRVLPYYAVKCYPEPGILKLLIALGAGFDCASKGELDMMLKMGVSPSRIIFAHPCKRTCDFRYARENGIQYTTFDTVSELHKVAEMDPEFKLVLRIRADDPGARVPLGLKYGAEVSEAPALLRTARELGLECCGVSFHVGSAAKNLATFTNAIENARKVFDEAASLGYRMELLDIGGGFTGHFDELGNVMFGEIANTINAALAKYFPPGCPELGDVRVIAEPGRYFAETSSTLFTPVIGTRDRVVKDGSIHKDYWLTDGLYGSFNCIVYDGQNPEYRVIRSPVQPEPTDTRTYLSTLWGPTCDSADVVYKDVALPALRNGDWLLWPNAGAYTVAGACDFNGIEFTHPCKVYVWSDSSVDPPEEQEQAAEQEGQEATGAAGQE